MYYAMLVGLGLILAIILHFILKEEWFNSKNLWIILLSTGLLIVWVLALYLMMRGHSGSFTEPIF